MNRSKLEAFIIETYNADRDYPWLKYPNYEVFRHCSNQKWFALIMDLPKSKLGLQGAELLDVVNFKCDPLLIGSLREEPGFFPAYHMNKDSWITVALDGSVPDDKIKMLLDMSYQATAPKTRKKKCWQLRVYQGEHLSIKNGSETNDDHCTDHGKDDRLFRREYP